MKKSSKTTVLNRYIQQFDSYLFVIFALPLWLLLINNQWIFTPLGIDPWIYYGYFFDLKDNLTYYPNVYYGTRLAWILPGYVIHQLFPPLLANYTLHLLVYYTAVYSFYLTAKITINRHAALIGTILLGSYLPFIAIAGWNYVDGAGVAYTLLTTFFLTKAARSSYWKWWLILAGISFAASVHTHMILLLFTPIHCLYYLYSNFHYQKNSVIRSLVFAGIGEVGLTLLFCFINQSLGGKFWFFLPSVGISARAARGISQVDTYPEHMWFTTRHHLVLPVITLIGAMVIIRRESFLQLLTDQFSATYFQIQFILTLLIYGFIHIYVGGSFSLFAHGHYIVYLIPTMFFALVGFLFSQYSTLPPCRYLVTILGTIIIVTIPFAFKIWRDLPIMKDRHQKLLDFFLENEQISNIYEDMDECVFLLEDERKRFDFAEGLHLFLQSMDIILPRPEALPYVQDAKQFGVISRSAANLYRDEDLNIAGVGHKVRQLIDDHIKAHHINLTIPLIPIMDAEFDEQVQRHPSTRSKALEIEYAARYEIRVSFETDPVYFQKMSDRLQAILDAYEENWNALFEALREYIGELRAGRSADQTSLDPRKQSPFMSILVDEAGLDEHELSSDELRQFAEATVEIVDIISSDISRIGFWQTPTLREELRGKIFMYLDQTDIFDLEQVGTVADRILQLAKRRHVELTSG